MTGFLALLGSDAPPAVEASGAAFWSGGPVRLLAERTPRPNGPRLAERGPYAIAADVRLDNRDDLRRALGDDGDDGDLLLAAYERWGIGLLDRVEGPFSFALWDGRAGRLHVARDAMGLRPLYQARVGGGRAFGSSLPTVRSLVPFRLDSESAADFLTGEAPHPTRTFTLGVERVPPAHAVVATPGGAVSSRRFWALDPAVRLPDDDAVVEGAFRDAFDRAVLARLDGPVGAFLSGGLDSSSIVTTARALRPALTLPTFSLIYDERTADERQFIEAVADPDRGDVHRVGAEAIPILGGVGGDLAAFGEPTPAANLFLTRHLYHEAAAAGLGAVLDGFGGDNVVAHGEQRLTELALGLRWPSFAREVRAVAAQAASPRRMALRLTRKYAFDPLVAPLRPAPDAVHFGRPGLVDDRKDRRPTYRTVRAAHVADIAGTMTPRAVEAAYATAAVAGVEPRFPFLDRRVVEVCFAVPSAQRVRDGLSRSYLRRAMRDRLPPAVRDRPGKARLGNNFVDALFVRDADALRRAVYDDAPAADLLDSPALRRAYERAEGDPTLRTDLALPLWRAAVFARWMATAPGRPSPPSEEAALLSSLAPAGVL